MLKNVVLPAPLGPMIETIDFSGMAKSTSSTRRQAAERLRDRQRLEDGAVCCASSSGLRLRASLMPAPRRTPRARSPTPAVSPAPMPSSSSLRLRSGSRPSGRSTIMITSRKPKIPKLSSVRSKSRPTFDRQRIQHVGDQVRVRERQHDRAQDHAPDVAHPAEDDHREHEDRERELELVRVHRVQVRAQERAGDPAERRARRVGEQLRPARAGRPCSPPRSRPRGRRSTRGRGASRAGGSSRTGRARPSRARSSTRVSG